MGEDYRRHAHPHRLLQSFFAGRVGVVRQRVTKDVKLLQRGANVFDRSANSDALGDTKRRETRPELGLAASATAYDEPNLLSADRSAHFCKTRMHLRLVDDTNVADARAIMLARHKAVQSAHIC